MQKHEWLAVVTLCICLLFLTIVSHFSYFSLPLKLEPSSYLVEEEKEIKIAEKESKKSKGRKRQNKRL